MKHLLCTLIAHAPACHVSPSDAAWHRAEHLLNEARTTAELLDVLLYQYNSAVEPQATMYRRIERLCAKAIARRERRSIASSIAMYRAIGKNWREVSPEHVFYAQITEALGKDKVLEVAR